MHIPALNGNTEEVYSSYLSDNSMLSKSYQNSVYENRQLWGVPEGHAIHPFSTNDEYYPWIIACHQRTVCLNGTILTVVKFTWQNWALLAVLILAFAEGCGRRQPSKLCLPFVAGMEARMLFSGSKSVFFMKTQGREFFSGQQDENLEELVCHYLEDSMALLTESISLFIWVSGKYTA